MFRIHIMFFISFFLMFPSEIFLAIKSETLLMVFLFLQSSPAIRMCTVCSLGLGDPEPAMVNPGAVRIWSMGSLHVSMGGRLGGRNEWNNSVNILIWNLLIWDTDNKSNYSIDVVIFFLFLCISTRHMLSIITNMTSPTWQ